MIKHAYMIMAHHRSDLLQLLIDAIDDQRNDIIVHIDKKSSMKPEQFSAKKANLYFVDSIIVNWGGYSQVECEYKLFKKAIEIGKHTYYHFLTGSSYPLWNQEYIHEFFIEHKGYEFIGFDNAIDFNRRLKYFVPFSEFGKLVGIQGRLIYLIRQFCIFIQKLMRVNRLKNYTIEIKKGCAYFSITEELLKEIIKQENLVKYLMRYSIWCDEVFVHTIAFNSMFRNRIFNLSNEWDGSLREIAWPSNIIGEHPGWNYTMKDLNYLFNSKRLFALKFESLDGIDVIYALKDKRNI